MKNYFRAPSVCAAFLFLVLPFVIACGGHAASGNPQAAAPPDLNGVWSAPFTPDISKTLGHQPPFTPLGAARFAKEDEIDDPLTKCLPIGPARGIQAGIMPFQIVQTPAVFTILFENQHTFRIIHTDGRGHPKDMDPTWFGDSIGKWDGDALVVDTVGFNDKAWFDDAAHPHTEKLHVTERYRRVDFGHMDFDVTIDDPGAYTRPFTLYGHSHLLEHTEIMEYVCLENHQQDLVHIV